MKRGLLSWRPVKACLKRGHAVQAFYLDFVTPEYIKQRKREIKEKLGKANAETPAY